MASQDLIRLGSYLSVLVIMATWELIAPRRKLTASKLCRWGGNLTIVVLNTAIARLLFAGGVVATAVMAQEGGWGLLNWVDWPGWLEMGLAVVALDLVIYCQHQVFHLVPILWRFHMMHHSDLDLDVSSGVRFHPVEIVISMVVKSVAVIALGVSPLAVVVFEIVLNSTALWDDTLGRVREASGIDSRIVPVWAPENRCVVDAYFRGYREALAAGCGWILEMDGGLSHLPEEIPRFLEAMETGVDFAAGSRFVPGGRYRGRWSRYVLSRGGTLIVNLLLGTRMSDMTSGFECFTARALRHVLSAGVRSRRHFFQTEIRVLLHGFSWA